MLGGTCKTTDYRVKNYTYLIIPIIYAMSVYINTDFLMEIRREQFETELYRHTVSCMCVLSTQRSFRKYDNII